MIMEDYVSFETAKLLKEKGFNQITIDSYRANGKLRGEYKSCNYPCPTQQMAMKWLKENHQIFIRPNMSFLYPIRYYCEIFCYGDNLKTQQDITTENFKSSEQACEAAIKYCLEHLI